MRLNRCMEQDAMMSPAEMNLLLGMTQKPNYIKKLEAGSHVLFIEDGVIEDVNVTLPFTSIDTESLDDQSKETIELLKSTKMETISFMLKQEPFMLYNLYVGDFMLGNEPINDREYATLIREFKFAKPTDKIVCSVDSCGGSVFEGYKMINAIKDNFTRDRIKTILSPKGYSMGSSFFIMGGERVVYEESSLMIHDYSTIMYGSGGQLKDRITHTEGMLNNYDYQYYVMGGHITEEEFKSVKDGKELWFDAVELAQRKIATHVILRDGGMITAEEYATIMTASEEELESMVTTMSKDELIQLSVDAHRDSEEISEEIVIDESKSKPRKPRVKKSKDTGK